MCTQARLVTRCSLPERSLETMNMWPRIRGSRIESHLVIVVNLEGSSTQRRSYEYISTAAHQQLTTCRPIRHTLHFTTRSKRQHAIVLVDGSARTDCPLIEICERSEERRVVRNKRRMILASQRHRDHSPLGTKESSVGSMQRG